MSKLNSVAKVLWAFLFFASVISFTVKGDEKSSRALLMTICCWCATKIVSNGFDGVNELLTKGKEEK